jgi:toxin ParE1/3/4
LELLRTICWQEHGRQDKIGREIGKAVSFLEDYPLGGRSRDEVRPGLRSLVASPHVVFYRVVDGAAEIVRVLDGRQDIEAILAKTD